MKQKAVVIGGGINGLVAANYLQRDGFDVTLLERKPVVGGACAFDSYVAGGKTYDYPTGATVLGFMQDFVYEETGLAKRLSIRAPQHPAVVWFESQDNPCFIYDDVERLRSEVKQKWGEEGNLKGFYSDLERVRAFIIRGYRSATVPNLEQAQKELGEELSRLWIAGSARGLMNHYFTSEHMKIFCSIEVMESGPVSIDSPFSAFTIPLMGSGTVLGGKWGFVKGGLWKLTEELGALNQELGVKVVTSAQVLSASQKDLSVTYLQDGSERTLQADSIIFATDPVSAARLLGERSLLDQVAGKKLLGTSGKLVMLFKKPIVWKDDSGQQDFGPAFKFIIEPNTLNELESTTQAVVNGGKDFVPGYYELYCEGAGMRSLGLERGYDSLTVYFKNLAFSKRGDELPEVKRAVGSTILKRVENADDLIGTILLTPKDLNERFFLPEGNIDHIELSDGQTFFSRNFSPDPAANFYQFGANEQIRLCSAGSYPCGSIAGTAGFMCAKQIIQARETAIV